MCGVQPHVFYKTVPVSDPVELARAVPGPYEALPPAGVPSGSLPDLVRRDQPLTPRSQVAGPAAADQQQVYSTVQYILQGRTFLRVRRIQMYGALLESRKCCCRDFEPALVMPVARLPAGRGARIPQYCSVQYMSIVLSCVKGETTGETGGLSSRLLYVRNPTGSDHRNMYDLTPKANRYFSQNKQVRNSHLFGLIDPLLQPELPSSDGSILITRLFCEFHRRTRRRPRLEHINEAVWRNKGFKVTECLLS